MQTARLSLFNPRELFRAVKHHSLYDAWLFGVVTMYISCAISLVFSFFRHSIGGNGVVTWFLLTFGGGQVAPGGFIQYSASTIFGLAIAPLLVPLFYGGIYAGLSHLAVRVLADRDSDFSATAKVAMFAMAPFLIAPVPMVRFNRIYAVVYLRVCGWPDDCLQDERISSRYGCDLAISSDVDSGRRHIGDRLLG